MGGVAQAVISGLRPVEMRGSSLPPVNACGELTLAGAHQATLSLSSSGQGEENKMEKNPSWIKIKAA